MGRDVAKMSRGVERQMVHRGPNYFICYVARVIAITEHSQKMRDPTLWTPLSEVR